MFIIYLWIIYMHPSAIMLYILQKNTKMEEF